MRNITPWAGAAREVRRPATAGSELTQLVMCLWFEVS